MLQHKEDDDINHFYYLGTCILNILCLNCKMKYIKKRFASTVNNGKFQLFLQKGKLFFEIFYVLAHTSLSIFTLTIHLIINVCQENKKWKKLFLIYAHINNMNSLSAANCQ